MGILDRLKKGDSTLSTSGLKPMSNTVAGENKVTEFFKGTSLGLSGAAPQSYKDKAPEGQSGRI